MLFIIIELEILKLQCNQSVNGISIVNTGLRSVSNVYFNTIYLNATSSGALFGSSEFIMQQVPLLILVL
jgi:hypothetical protein